MDIKTLEERVTKRAEELASSDIRTFKKAINTALDVLCKDTWDSRGQCLRVMASDNDSTGWPKQLWRVREERVRGEVLSTMDAIQRMLVSKGGGENTPEGSDDDGRKD